MNDDLSVASGTIVSMTNLYGPYVSSKESDSRAQEWLDNLDQRSSVGTRHHVVPRFLLERFASAKGQLQVRNRADGQVSMRSISDLAVRDFYTVVTNDGEFDSSLESVLSIVEDRAARILRQHLDHRAFMRPRTFTAEERYFLDDFVAIQAVRGMRTRRVIEVIADYSVKLLNQDRISDDDIQNIDFIPHPNEHLKMFGPLWDRVVEVLRRRSALIIHLDRPLLIIGDEPVIADRGENVSSVRDDAEHNWVSQDLILFEGGIGLANAETILIPVSASAILMYGPTGDYNLPAILEIKGEEASSFAEELNARVVETAIDWIAAHPDHTDFASLKIPSRRPVMHVHDRGSLAAKQVNSTPAHRPIRRLRPEDVQEVSPLV